MDIKLEDMYYQHWVGFRKVTAFVMAHTSLVADLPDVCQVDPITLVIES